MKNIAILGSTGSIGQQTLDVIRQHPDIFKVAALAANSNLEGIERQINEFKPQAIGWVDVKQAQTIKNKFSKLKVFSGENALMDLVQLDEIDIVVVAVTGAAGILPTLKAIESGKAVSLANKETLVVAGDLVNEALKKVETQNLASLLPPIDSEHSAIFQCLNGEDKNKISKIILTCSGGAFRNFSELQLKKATAQDALKHPTWKMGAKITIDCATLMNKGFEVIETHQLFGVPYEKIEVVIHPESKIHSMVEFVDGSVMAQISAPDMRIPIQYSLSYPERLENNFERLNFDGTTPPNLSSKRRGNDGAPPPYQGGAGGGLKLTFNQPNMEKFPCLKYAIEAGKIGGTMPAVLNAANEICVKNFLENKIKFLDIAKVIKQAMDKHKAIKTPNLKQILEVDNWARIYSQQIIDKI
jgi:1-deoxy-D-xylulose-5-phosphate reductoisomerase